MNIYIYIYTYVIYTYIKIYIIISPPNASSFILATRQGAPFHARDDAAGRGTSSLARERVELRLRTVATGHGWWMRVIKLYAPLKSW